MHKNQSHKEVVKNFMNLCATIIQANFKGYMQRKYYKKFLPVYRRFKQLLYAGFLGWKTRRALKLSIVKAKINHIQTLKKQQKNMQARIAKRDFSDEINRLLKNGLWVFYFMKEKNNPLSQRSISMNNKNQIKSIVKTNLKQAFKIIPKPNNKSALLKEKEEVIQIMQQTKMDGKNKKQTQQKQILLEKSKRKDPKFKKFEAPPKEIKLQKKQKQTKLEIQTSIIQLEVDKQMLNQCQTPSEFLHQQKINQFTFHTKPRYQSILMNREILQKQVQPAFMKIDMLSYSSRKGLNMTLSKKYTNEIKEHSQDMSKQNEFSNFNKINIASKETQNFSDKYSSLSTNDVTPFNQFQRIKAEKSIKPQKIAMLLQKKTLITLDMKKFDFQKKKLEFQKRSQKFNRAVA